MKAGKAPIEKLIFSNFTSAEVFVRAFQLIALLSSNFHFEQQLDCFLLGSFYSTLINIPLRRNLFELDGNKSNSRFII